MNVPPKLVGDKLGCPVIIRVVFALGGFTNGLAEDASQFRVFASNVLADAGQSLVEKVCREMITKGCVT